MMECLFAETAKIILADSDDIARWIQDKRWDILRFINICNGIHNSSDHEKPNGLIYPRYDNCFEKTFSTGGQCENCSGGDLTDPDGCIFLLQNNICGIHETKPNGCREHDVSCQSSQNC